MRFVSKKRVLKLTAIAVAGGVSSAWGQTVAPPQYTISEVGLTGGVHSWTNSSNVVTQSAGFYNNYTNFGTSNRYNSTGGSLGVDAWAGAGQTQIGLYSGAMYQNTVTGGASNPVDPVHLPRSVRAVLLLQEHPFGMRRFIPLRLIT